MGEGRQYSTICPNKASRPLQQTRGHWSSCLIPSPSIQVTAVYPSRTLYLLDKTFLYQETVTCCVLPGLSFPFAEVAKPPAASQPISHFQILSQRVRPRPAMTLVPVLVLPETSRRLSPLLPIPGTSPVK